MRRRKGISGIFSGVFIVLITMLIFSALVWQVFRSDQYNQVVLARQQREWERLNERLLITNVQKGVTKLEFDVTNYGAVTACLTDLYLTNLTAIPRHNSRHTLNVWINPGNLTHVLTGISILIAATYSFIVTTARGNAFAPSPPVTVNVLQPLAGQPVPFALTWTRDSFQYIRKGQTWSTPQTAWRIVEPKGNYVVFRINVTSHYTTNVLLLSGGNLLIVSADVGGNLNARYKMWIVQEAATIDGSNKVPPFPSEGLWIPANQSKYVYFSSTAERGSDAARLSTNAEDLDLQLFAGIFFKVSGDPYDTIYGATVAIIAMQIKTY